MKPRYHVCSDDGNILACFLTKAAATKYAVMHPVEGLYVWKEVNEHFCPVHKVDHKY